MMKKEKKVILGIETSCDETAAAVVQKISLDRKTTGFQILSNVIISQVRTHKKYGGIVPEVAARKHIKNILPVIDMAIQQAQRKPADLDGIAVTYGPGLITSLLVGVEVARTLSYVWKKPLIGVDHIRAHIFAVLLPHAEEAFSSVNIPFPAVALVVSGGHTELFVIRRKWKVAKIGQTLDDASGEAFDKVAKMLNLGFPGGPVVSQMAEKGDPEKYPFPRPMMYSGNFLFSFSGLKTAVLYTIQKLTAKRTLSQQMKRDICAGFQQAVVDVLTRKTLQAAKCYGARSIILGGGVAANRLLRSTLAKGAADQGVEFFVPDLRLCTDNGAMIAAAGFFEKSVLPIRLTADPQLSREGER